LGAGESLNAENQLDIMYLWFPRWIFVVRWLGGHLLEHSMETHVDFSITLDQFLEIPDDGKEWFGFYIALYGPSTEPSR
jgi:hypothetical protein